MPKWQLQLNSFTLMLDPAITKYLQLPHKKGGAKYDLSKFIIWVIRVSGSNIRDAMPCSRCCKNLKNLGFRKVAFSNSDGEIEMIDLRRFSNNHLSRAQIITAKYSKII